METVSDLVLILAISLFVAVIMELSERRAAAKRKRLRARAFTEK